MKNLRTIFLPALAAALLFLAGCASVPTINTEAPGPDAGYFVVSLGSGDGMYVSSHRLYVRDVKTRAIANVTYLQENLFRKTERDFDSKDRNGAVLHLRLPPGDYELYDFSSFINGYPSTTTFSTKAGFAVPFKVETGKVAYLGEYLGYYMYGRSLIGLRVPAFIYMVVTDQAERDIAALEGRSTLPRGLPVSKFVADEKRVRHELIRNSKFPYTDLPRR